MKSKIVSILIFIFFAGTYAMAADVQTHYFGYEAEGGEGGLPKTGQTVQYTSGDDGTYEMGWSGTRFTANGDGTITDNATGLMWVANPTAAGVGSTYAWATAVSNCEGLTYAGYNDWRLPNVTELISIVDRGTFSPSIDGVFTCVSSYSYDWSSTTVVGNTTIAWYVGVYDGDVVYGGKANTGYVRPVRGGQ